jgi:Uncharacterized protein conserved in bacteria (DUF2252)
MQAESDIFLGWTRFTGPDGVDRDFNVRQLKDWKFSVPIEQMVPGGMAVYAGLCGRTLARAPARSGDRIALAAYLGGSASFDQAIADFAETYADQNEVDYAAFQAARKKARLKQRPRSETASGPGARSQARYPLRKSPFLPGSGPFLPGSAARRRPGGRMVALSSPSLGDAPGRGAVMGWQCNQRASGPPIP